MKKYDHIRKKAILFRQKGYSYGEIRDRLNISKSTLHYWLKNVSSIVKRKSKLQTSAQKKATSSMVKKYKIVRDQAYTESLKMANDVLKDQKMRDFAIIYLCEGFRRTRHTVSVANSNPQMIKFCHDIMINNSCNKMDYRIQYHVDQDIDNLRSFWADVLNVDINKIKVARKSNSGKMKGRNWRSRYGVFTVRTNDVVFRAKLQALMDHICNQW